jgi:beta-galactosidase/beta-glucuronidase
MKRLLVWIATAVLLNWNVAQAEVKPWPPPEGAPVTRWGKEVSADKPVLPEYPRPQMVRKQWMNLNGLWDYSITDRAEGDGQKVSWQGKILVPYPVESILSQVNKRIDDGNRLWYRRTFVIPNAWSGQRVLLHFGAVDWETTVWVNHQEVGVHRGGYDGFSFDVTDALKPDGPQEVVVAVWDPTEGGQPEGKQSRKPEGIFYTPTSGIWQTVWMEPVPESYIKELKIIPDVDNAKVLISAVVVGQVGKVSAEVLINGKTIARGNGEPGGVLSVSIPKARLWWPDDPFLYDLKVSIRKGFRTLDTVTGYFGMRKISLGPDSKGRTRMLLNNRFVFQNGVLDQGFWPDGLYTAPTDEALRYDVEMTRKLGFNMSRKHIKVEPDRWYYWCDKLGLMVWQDMPSVILRRKAMIPDVDAQFETEQRRMIGGMFNHPSIVMWVLFNEGWGLEMKPPERVTPSDATRTMMQRMFAAARQEDSTRLINHESGAGGKAWQGKNPYDIGLGDIVDFHCYGGRGPLWEKTRASVIGETGWGSSLPNSVAIRLSEMEELGISGIIITQLTDVENETNGAFTYDRILKGKTSAEEIGKLMREQLLKGLGSGCYGPSGMK